MSVKQSLRHSAAKHLKSSSYENSNHNAISGSDHGIVYGYMLKNLSCTFIWICNINSVTLCGSWEGKNIDYEQTNKEIPSDSTYVWNKHHYGSFLQ